MRAAMDIDQEDFLDVSRRERNDKSRFCSKTCDESNRGQRELPKFSL